MKVLQKLGLTQYEARAYLSLAELGPSIAREIAKHSLLPRNKTYDALEQLEQKGLATHLPLSPKRYKITNPDLLFEQAQTINTTLQQLVQLIESPKPKNAQNVFTLIQGQKATQEKLANQNTKAQNEILSCNHFFKILPKNIRILAETVERGVKVRIICKYDPKYHPSYKAWLSTGAEIRAYNHEKLGHTFPRINLFDQSIAAITLGEPEIQNRADYITLWMESPSLAELLRSQYLAMWKHSTPLKKLINE